MAYSICARNNYHKLLLGAKKIKQCGVHALCIRTLQSPRPYQKQPPNTKPVVVAPHPKGKVKTIYIYFKEQRYKS